MIADFFAAVGEVLSAEITYLSGWRFAAALGFVAVGEWVAERSGAINISVEGAMLAGAFMSVVGHSLPGSVAVGLLFATLAGLMVAVVQAHLSHNLAVNQFVVGLTLNILVLGAAGFLDGSLNLPQPQTAASWKCQVWLRSRC